MSVLLLMSEKQPSKSSLDRQSLWTASLINLHSSTLQILPSSLVYVFLLMAKKVGDTARRKERRRKRRLKFLIQKKERKKRRLKFRTDGRKCETDGTFWQERSSASCFEQQCKVMPLSASNIWSCIYIRLHRFWLISHCHFYYSWKNVLDCCKASYSIFLSFRYNIFVTFLCKYTI